MVEQYKAVAIGTAL